MEQSTVDLRDGEEVKPYKIHVSSKYLDLTKKKLELTRLPHELLVPRAREWEYGTPKSEIEPLVDFWLEHYSWRTRETTLNTTYPQFRTAITIPNNPHPIRIHFLHILSPQANAIPLLLLPSFPSANLSPLLTPLITPLTTPNIPTSQAFHLIIPSLPGLGFSDAFQTDTNLLYQTALLFHTLMRDRLGYEFYLTSATGSGRASPAGIDHHLARLIGYTYPENCLGVHLIEPLLSPPKAGTWAWTKFTIAKFFHLNAFGYTSSDFQSLQKAKSALKVRAKAKQEEQRTGGLRGDGRVRRGGFGIVGTLGLREPNTLAYALCDSPVGLLSFVCSVLRKVSPQHGLSSEEIIDVTQLAWLPGPEAGMRFWSVAAEEGRGLRYGGGNGARRKGRCRVAVTVFEDEEEGYVCPAWIGGEAEVVWSQRVQGQAGLVAFERGDVVVEGVRGLARGVREVDARLRLSGLEEVVVGNGNGPATIVEEEHEDVEEEHEDVEELGQWEVESPDTVVHLIVR